MLTTFGAISVGLGVYFLFGGKQDQAHDVLPFIMLGIGVDDMLVVCKALDSVSLKLGPRERFEKAIRFAGPSITISTLTNAMAFLAGA